MQRKSETIISIGERYHSSLVLIDILSVSYFLFLWVNICLFLISVCKNRQNIWFLQILARKKNILAWRLFFLMSSLRRAKQIFGIIQILPFPLILGPKQVPTKSYANPIFLPLQGTDSQRYHNGITTEGEYRFGWHENFNYFNNFN